MTEHDSSPEAYQHYTDVDTQARVSKWAEEISRCRPYHPSAPPSRSLVPLHRLPRRRQNQPTRHTDPPPAAVPQQTPRSFPLHEVHHQRAATATKHWSSPVNLTPTLDVPVRKLHTVLEDFNLPDLGGYDFPQRQRKNSSNSVPAPFYAAHGTPTAHRPGTLVAPSTTPLPVADFAPSEQFHYQARNAAILACPEPEPVGKWESLFAWIFRG